MRAGFLMPIGILAWRIKFMMMVRMLDRPNTETFRNKLFDQVLDKRCFSAVLTTDYVNPFQFMRSLTKENRFCVRHGARSRPAFEAGSFSRRFQHAKHDNANFRPRMDLSAEPAERFRGPGPPPASRHRPLRAGSQRAPVRQLDWIRKPSE